MDKNNLTPEESLTIISKAIENFRMSYKDNAQSFLLWGWILTLASFSNFIILKVLHSMELYRMMGLLSFANWFVFCLTGFIFLFFMERKVNRNRKVYSHLDGYIKSLWIVTATSFFVASLVCIKLEIAPPPIMLLIAGIATTTTGILIKFRPLIFGGLSFFAFSIATTFIMNEYMSLVTGVSIICGYLIPGYFLKAVKE